jgi:hypothetical protein
VTSARAAARLAPEGDDVIELLQDLPPGVIGFRAVGTVTAADYRDVLDPRSTRRSPRPAGSTS